MAQELGATADPKALIPGNPGTVAGTAAALKTRGDALHEAGNGLKRIDTTEGWSGEAGDAFRAAFDGDPAKWLEAGDCFHDAAKALETYNSTLTWAQGQAEEAIRQWQEGQTASDQAKAQHDQEQQQTGQSLPLDDPGETKRQAAQGILDRARSQLNDAGHQAERAVAAARNKAPEKPGLWAEVSDAAQNMGAGLANTAGTVVNGLASFGNAMLTHPADVAAIAGGAGLVVAGATGEVAGVALDATGGGAALGVPTNIASAGLIGTGGAMAAAGAGDLMMHAASDDSAAPMETDHAGSDEDDYEPTEGFRDSEFSQDEIVEFVNGHTGDGDPTMGRPGSAEVNDALTQGTPEKLEGQNAEKFEHDGVRVIVNYDMPWRSTSYYPGK